MPPGADELAQRLAGAVTEVADVLEELKEIALGLHPAVLTDTGLRSALRALVRRSGVPVSLDVRVKGRLPEPVEVAAYYAVAEALTNIAKYAGASAAEVEATAREDVLQVRVRDDGRGGADFGRGSGLSGLKDRIEALGGRISLHSPPGAGTTVQIALPLSGLSRLVAESPGPGPGFPAGLRPLRPHRRRGPVRSEREKSCPVWRPSDPGHRSGLPGRATALAGRRPAPPSWSALFSRWRA